MVYFPDGREVMKTAARCKDNVHRRKIRGPKGGQGSMKHLRPLSRAAMTWYDTTILDYIYAALSFLATIIPVLDSLVVSKEDGADEEER